MFVIVNQNLLFPNGAGDQLKMLYFHITDELVPHAIKSFDMGVCMCKWKDKGIIVDIWTIPILSLSFSL